MQGLRSISAHLRALAKVKGEVATFDFVPFAGDPRECRGYVAFPPTGGPPRSRVGENRIFIRPSPSRGVGAYNHLFTYQPPAGVAAGLGLDLGREAIPCTNPAYAPRFTALGLKPPKSSSADHVGVQTQAFPTQSTPPPKPSPCQQWATNRQWVPPPPLFLLGGEDVGLRQLKHLHPHFGGRGGGPPSIASPAPLPPPQPVDHPMRRGLSRWTTPPLVHPYPPPRPQQPVVHLARPGTGAPPVAFYFLLSTFYFFSLALTIFSPLSCYSSPPPPFTVKNVPRRLQQCAPPPSTPDGRLPPHPLLAFARAAAPLDPLLAARGAGFEPGTSEAGVQGASTEARGTSPAMGYPIHTATWHTCDCHTP